VRAWSFHVLGEPAPQGSKSPKGYRGGHAVLVESSKRVAPWRGSVTAAAFGAGPCLDGPLVVGMVFALRRPASARKRDTAPYRYPDLSKLARSTEDAITTAGLWADDARVAAYAPLVKAFAGWLVPGLDDVMVPVPGAIVACAELGPGAFDLVAKLLVKEAETLCQRKGAA
jgi:Holliday junction resolvase RusA-like endonuclease